MARPKRTSPALIKAEQREAGMRSIDETLDLGNGLNLQNYSNKIQNLRSHLSLYNTNLAQLDDLTRKIKAIEADLNKASEKILLSIGGRYGKDSSEYGKAGGSPRGERRRRTTAQNIDRVVLVLPAAYPSRSVNLVRLLSSTLPRGEY